MNRLLVPLMLFLLASCAEPPTEPVANDDSTVVDFYYVAKRPDWPKGETGGTYWQTEVGEGIIVTPDSIIENKPPNRTALPIEVLRNGNEIWIGTTQGEYRFRGVVFDNMQGYIIIEAANGRPGPLQFITLRRVTHE